MDKTANIKETEIITENSETPVVKENTEVDNNASAIPEKKKKRRRKKLHEITAENDIKYRGPFSYRHLRIFAWVFLAIAQIATLLTVAGKVDKNWWQEISGFVSVLSFAGNLTLPLFLIAAFALILNAKDGYKKILRLYSVCSLAFILGFYFVFFHYVVGFCRTTTTDWISAYETAKNLFYIIANDGFLAFNIFIDLLLCTLFTFFINYHPVKRFQGKKIIIFRLLALIPVMYEIASIVIKILASTHKLVVPIYVYPFLTTKPPVMFLMFLALALFIKIREHKYRKYGKTLKEYRAFLKTNANSLHFSVYTSIIIVISVIIDILLLVLVTAIMYVSNGSGGDEAVEAVEILAAFSTAYKMGFGGSVVLLFAIPFVMLFSYTKTYKNDIVDKIIPLAGVGLIVVVYVEGIFRIICLLPQLLQSLA